ncbi:carboxypeptidase regulatory-like domain-containing protein [Croceibacterium sp. LX-88]|uniref:Carboxypeptidase regulatory-like domain-containing protein n=1 Tax=Croceibacterium selenioxidans TaxID=2838833 RepID=A0ABS5W670_9SPHN|nr:carboxypeptidase-like regulatory domain-containing protein [Croceibacterium selenioxidans]MBT2135258.1 carboxypeptidase regulatory-like domain-containing protein [Croceibacterium selenioxidans]
MFGLLRLKAVATFAAACLPFWGAAALAQDGHYTPSEEDSVLFQLQVKQYRLMNEVRGYRTPDGVCVDLADLIQSLDIPVRLDRKSRRATGWIFAEEQTLTIDRDTSTVQTMNMTRGLQPGEIHDTPEGWCIDTRSLGGWLGVTLTPNLRNSSLTIDSEKRLPFVDAIERQSRAARLHPERERTDFSAYPQARQPYALWRMPSVDVVAQANYNHGGRHSQLNTRYEIFASGEVARASFDLRLASDSDGVPDSLRIRAYRMDPDRGLLGPLKATQAVAGDVDMISGNLAGASGAGRGAFISNRALDQSDRFGTTILRGTLPLGWDAELYRNGQLLAFQNNKPDGRYEFEVNLLFGNNDLDVVLYGPQGQIRRESKDIQIGYDSLPPGTIEYWAGVIQRNHDLISFGRPPPGSRLDAGWQYAAGAQYGLDRRTVIGANAHSLYYALRRRDYLELNLQRALGPVLINLSGAQELGRGRAYKLDMIGKIGQLNIQGQSLLVDGSFVSGLIDPRDKTSHSLNVDTFLPSQRMPISLSGGMKITDRRDGSQVNEAAARASLLMPRVSLTGYVTYRDTVGQSDWDDGTRIGLLANTRFLGLTARGEASYKVDGQQTGFDKASLTIEKNLGGLSELRLDIEHTHRTGTTEFDLGLIRQFRKVAITASGSVDTEGSVGANVALNFSLGQDPLTGRWRLSSEKLAQRGQAAISVFLDENGDGRRSDDEEPLTSVGVNAGAVGSSEPTDQLGHTIVEGLQPYQKVLIGIDESTLPDPFLMPQGKGVVVTPRPGISSVIEIAVSPTGEVEGTLNGPENVPLAGAKLNLIDCNGAVAASTVSEYDGFFLFDRVVYGRYQLRLASDSQAVLGVDAHVADGIEIGPQQTIDRLGTVRLHLASQIAHGPRSQGQTGP